MASEHPSEPHWQTLSEGTVYSGRMTIVQREALLPGGERISFEVDASIPFAVAILVLTSNGEVYLSRQYRYPIDRWIYDLPGGAGNADETPMEAAARECEEETGLVPLDLTPLHTFWLNPGRSSWPVHIFACTATTPGTVDRSDPSEQITAVRMPVRELDDLIATGEIVDPTLLVARLMAGVRGLL